MPIKSQTELLGLNRSGLYYRPLAPSAEEVALKHRIDELYTASSFLGLAAHYGNTSSGGLASQPQGSAAAYAGDGDCRHQSGAKLKQTPQ